MLFFYTVLEDVLSVHLQCSGKLLSTSVVIASPPIQCDLKQAFSF